MKLPLLFAGLVLTLPGQPTLTVGTASGTPNSVVRLPLTLSGVGSPPPTSLQWTVTYPSTFSITQTEGPAAVAAAKTIYCATTTPGLKSTICLLCGINTNTLTDGIAAYLNVSLPVSFVQTTQIAISGTLGASLEGNAVTVSGVSGAVLAVASRCDLNSDNAVNVLDVQLLANIVLQKTPCPKASCDLTGDGIVNVLDVQKLLNVILGKIACPN